MITTILSWFTKEARIEPFYASREVWTYKHTDPQTKRVSTRTVLIFRKASDGMFWGLPLTKTKRNGKPLYIPRLKNGRPLSPLSQMRTLKASNLLTKIGSANEKEFSALSRSIVRLLVANDPILSMRNRTRRKAPAYQISQRTIPTRVPAYILQPRFV